MNVKSLEPWNMNKNARKCMEMNVKSLEPRRRFLSDFIIFLRYLADKVLQNLVTVCNRRSIFGFNILLPTKNPLREYALCILMSEYSKIVNCTVWQEKKNILLRIGHLFWPNLTFFAHVIFIKYTRRRFTKLSTWWAQTDYFLPIGETLCISPFFFPFITPKVCLAKFMLKIKIHTPGPQSLID